jgi:uncharacterized protein YrzB (UPF0473 family)
MNIVKTLRDLSLAPTQLSKWTKSYNGTVLEGETPQFVFTPIWLYSADLQIKDDLYFRLIIDFQAPEDRLSYVALDIIRKEEHDVDLYNVCAYDSLIEAKDLNLNDLVLNIFPELRDRDLRNTEEVFQDEVNALLSIVNDFFDQQLNQLSLF